MKTSIASNKTAPCKDSCLSVHKQQPFTTATLFGDASEIQIEHRGERYSLRITRNGKLILTK